VALTASILTRDLKDLMRILHRARRKNPFSNRLKQADFNRRSGGNHLAWLQGDETIGADQAGQHM